jgi:hypothetical protein
MTIYASDTKGISYGLDVYINAMYLRARYINTPKLDVTIAINKMHR